ncbi:Hypothetical protein, putative [Bodo saltans]|uniref:Uncharacterized protein n=1 Tax=Bodo saltans TaxID=75058 RepID=A0A0S4IX27_BODSA|nr:Hypothetical protein, putative [Bodo saltans]|eukprot:CUG06684.1 Hypothetical protein, putative [Bodo saltans]
MSSISRPSVASDVVAVLVHPPRTTEHNGECSLDYLDAQRLQQYCDLPPPPVGTDSSSSASLLNANSSNQEAILIRLPSTVAPHYKFSVAYISCHANNGTIASELRQSKHHYVSPPTESNNNNTGAASPDSSSPAGSPSHKSGGSGGRPLSPAPAIPITKRTNPNSVVAMPPGFSRRLTEIGGVCARTFPADWWGTTNNTAAAAQRNNTININRQQQQQKFFLQQRLGMFFLVEYSTQVFHVTRFSLLCVTDAPMLPRPIVSLPTSLSPILRNQENHKHAASKKKQAAASPLVVDDETPEDISWTIPSNKKEEPTVVRNGTSANHPSGADVETGVATSRWTFVMQQSHSQQHQPQHKNSSASANDFNTHARHLKRAEEAADRRMRAASPGGFLLPSTQDFEKAPQGRYEHHRSESNRHVLSKTTRPAWQVYDQQRYDDAVHDAERFSREHVSAADQLEHQRPLAEHEIESYAYLTGQREGSMLGYLVDGPSPIARLDNLKVTAPAASVSRSTLLLTATNTNAMDHGNSATTVVHVAGGGGGTSCTAVPASHLHSTSSECISSQTLRLLQTTERNNVMTRTADPFLRIRNGLIPAIQRHRPKQHRPQQQRHARKDVVGTVEKELSPSRQQLAPIPSVEFVATTIAANKLMTPTSSTIGCIVVDHNASGSALANTTQRTMMGPRIGRASNRHAKPVQRRTFLDRFVEAVERIEIARGCDAIGNPLLLPRTGEDGSSSASSSSPHSNHDQQSHHHRRPTPLVAFGGLTPGNGVGLGGSVNTPWTPWRTTPIAGLKDPAASSGRGGVSFATDTPRSAFKRLLCIEPITQSLDDFFYAIYSLHGGAASSSTAEDSSSLTRQQQQQLGVTSMTKLPIVSHAAPEVALEALFWMAHHAPCKLGSAVVMVRRKENSVDEASGTTASLEQPSTATPTEAAEQPSPTASPAAKGFECTVTLQVVNDYAALAKIKTVLERTLDMLTTRISSNPLPLTESLRSCIRNRKQFTRVSVAEAFEAHVRQRRKSVASEVPHVQSTTPAVIRGGGSKAARVGRDEDEDDETVIKRRGVDLSSLFYDSVPTCSINEWMMKAE